MQRYGFLAHQTSDLCRKTCFEIRFCTKGHDLCNSDSFFWFKNPRPNTLYSFSQVGRSSQTSWKFIFEYYFRKSRFKERFSRQVWLQKSLSQLFWLNEKVCTYIFESTLTDIIMESLLYVLSFWIVYLITLSVIG